MLQIRAEGAQPGFVLFDQAGEKVALGGHLAEFVVFAHVPAPKVRAVLRVRGRPGNFSCARSLGRIFGAVATVAAQAVDKLGTAWRRHHQKRVCRGWVKAAPCQRRKPCSRR
ncbi:hypothetical protein [Xanthomonas oryzae]|uniref:hypothetical protein n=1 Tax=Xanthomonas oryzae TaxID=347 RepID=UPI0013C2FD0D|nr:hypothetical protein [Xanthomonas oryzae]